MIRIGFKHSFGETSFDIEMSVPSVGVTAIFGRSGAGKSTIAQVLMGLLTPQLGKITWHEELLLDTGTNHSSATWLRQFAMVFQEPRLFPHMSVEENLKYGIKQFDAKHFDEIITLLDLNNKLSASPHHLSGGEAQRVAIGRSLLSKPRLLIMDEPLSALDIPRKQELLEYLEKLHVSIDIPIIYITHSLQEIVQLADHMIMVDRGKVIASGTPEKVWASDLMQDWLPNKQKSALLSVSVIREANEYGFYETQIEPKLTLWLANKNLAVGQTIRIQIDASSVSLTRDIPRNSSIRNILPVKVSAIRAYQYENSMNCLVELQVGKVQTIWANVTQWAIDEMQLNVGEKIYAQIKSVSIETTRGKPKN